MKTRMGRPPKYGDSSLDKRLELRVTSVEKAAYDEAADSSGMERSDWIRFVLKREIEKQPKKSH
jgi:uncharacterized protein (DUF1778 family)